MTKMRGSLLMMRCFDEGNCEESQLRGVRFE